MKRVLRSRLRAELVVTMKDGRSWRGVFFEGDAQTLVLRNSVALGIGHEGANVAVDGELLLLVADVAYIQRP